MTTLGRQLLLWSLDLLVTLTFDDGLENVVTQAYPIMRELGAKGCVYVVTDYVGTDHLLWPDLISKALEAGSGEPFRLTVQGRVLTFETESADQRRKSRAAIKALCQSLSNQERIDVIGQIAEQVSPSGGPEFRMASWEDSAIKPYAWIRKPA